MNTTSQQPPVYGNLPGPKAPKTVTMRRGWFIAMLIGVFLAGSGAGHSTGRNAAEEEMVEAAADAEATTTTTEATTTTAAPTTTTTEAPATTTTAAPTTTTTSTTVPEPEGFGNGVWIVGTDIEPGQYRTDGPGSGEFDLCYWARLSGLTGDFDDLIVNGIPDGPAVVEILPSDAAFESDGCGEWTAVDQ